MSSCGNDSCPSPLALLLQKQLKSSRRQLLHDLAVQIQTIRSSSSSTTGGKNRQPNISADGFASLKEVQIAQRRLAYLDHIHSCVSRIIDGVPSTPQRIRPHYATGDLEHLYAPQDPLLQLATSCWRPLVLGQAWATWLTHTARSLERSGLAARYEASIAQLTQKKLGLLWAKVCGQHASIKPACYVGAELVPINACRCACSGASTSSSRCVTNRRAEGFYHVTLHELAFCDGNGMRVQNPSWHTQWRRALMSRALCRLHVRLRNASNQTTCREQILRFIERDADHEGLSWNWSMATRAYLPAPLHHPLPCLHHSAEDCAPVGKWAKPWLDAHNSTRGEMPELHVWEALAAEDPAAVYSAIIALPAKEAEALCVALGL